MVKASSGFYGDGEGYADAMTGCGFQAITELGISASGQWSYTVLGQVWGYGMADADELSHTWRRSYRKQQKGSCRCTPSGMVFIRCIRQADQCSECLWSNAPGSCEAVTKQSGPNQSLSDGRLNVLIFP